jgi:hypothetical protein
MALNNKIHGGYIGYYRFTDANSAEGVWNLRMQQTEASNFTWVGQEVYKFKPDGNLDGWTNSGLTLNTGVGNPTAPAIQVSPGTYGYIDPITYGTSLYGYAGEIPDSLLYTTVVMDVYLTGGAVGFHFAHASNGQGPFLKLDGRGGSFRSGIMYNTSWGVYGGEPAGTVTHPLNQWVTVKVRIQNSALVRWYTEFNERDDQTVLINGTNIGLRWFAGSGVAYVDNLRVYRGAI